ncbi:MAG TPA: GntR family transcriptional regulator [Bauldia sp.]|nr:GntR family transcriptional regulator [Bauldia sp.]
MPHSASETTAKTAAPLYEVIYAVLREHIEDGSFPSGLVLGESSVARAFRASRVPAAAALRRLRREGLLRDFAGRGYLTGKGDAGPLRLELHEAGLRLPPDIATDLKVRNRRERIYPAVEHVIAGALPFGRFQVNESALADHHRVSRTVAHEVLTRLERIGLVTQDSNQRWYAGRLTEDGLRDHFEMRCLLEPIALDQAMDEVSRAEVKERWERARRAAEMRHTLDRIERLERDLHIDIVLRCRNLQLREAIRRSQLVLVAIHHAFDLYRDSAVISLMVSEHVSIFGHILAGRRERAKKALEAHLTRSFTQNLEIVRSLGPLPDERRPPYLVQVPG